MVFAVVALVLHDRWLNLEADVVLRDVMLIASFTTIGLNASVRVLRKAGVQVGLLAGLAFLGAIAQGIVGVGLSTALGLDPRIGILAGVVALAGGPATSLAFGPVFERMGVAGATTLSLASATFGISVAGLLAGWTGGLLIRQSRLAPLPEQSQHAKEAQRRKRGNLLTHVLVLTFAMGLGNLISLGVAKSGVVLPGFVGAMLAAVLVRNFDEWTDWFGIHTDTVDQILGIVLPLFISMAMLTLKLWELTVIAFPLLTILIVEVVLTWLFSVIITFRVMGRDYESAVMTTGFCGFMVGITPNAMASMEELTEKYAPAPRALLVVPLVGAFLIDLTNSLVVTAFANLLR
jgi:ESS family glutamate:Na+ symporter